MRPALYHVLAASAVTFAQGITSNMDSSVLLSPTATRTSRSTSTTTVTVYLKLAAHPNTTNLATSNVTAPFTVIGMQTPLLNNTAIIMPQQALTNLSTTVILSTLQRESALTLSALSTSTGNATIAHPNAVPSVQAKSGSAKAVEPVGHFGTGLAAAVAVGIAYAANVHY